MNDSPTKTTPNSKDEAARILMELLGKHPGGSAAAILNAVEVLTAAVLTAGSMAGFFSASTGSPAVQEVLAAKKAGEAAAEHISAEQREHIRRMLGLDKDVQ